MSASLSPPPTQPVNQKKMPALCGVCDGKGHYLSRYTGRRVACRTCGPKPLYQPRTCAVCDGTGSLYNRASNQFFDCSTCQGLGYENIPAETRRGEGEASRG